MAAEAPNSFRDPYWLALADTTGQKLGLPDGLLSAIVSKGERSNNDAVSSAGAKTVFQITPSTRKLALDKFGVDAYLSPENAAEVAGKLLKDSLDRNGGDPKAAIGEYVGGVDRKNWGPVTKGYIARVSAALPVAAAAPDQAAGAPAAGAMPDGSQSTFDRLSAQQSAAAPTSAIANIFAAYQADKMTPEQAQAFEGDVKDGKLMLPPGAALKQDAAAPGPEANIVAAYNARKMTPEQQSALERDVQSGAFKMPAGLSLNIPGTAEGSGIPGAGAGVTGPVAQAPSGLGPQLVGLGEAAVHGATGVVGGTAGMIGGGALGLVQDVRALARGEVNPNNLETLAQAGSQALTYQPRTAIGQQRSDQVDAAAQNLLPLAPMAGEMAALGRGAAPVATMARDAARATPAAAADLAGAVASRVRAVMPGGDASTPTAGTKGSVGAAGVDMATQRRAAAADLPVPIELTEGQATRTFEQQQFERETAKSATAGAPLRERFAEQNAAMAQNIDAFIDQTGAEAPNLRAAGVAVDSALNAAVKADKNRVRVAYEKAGKSEEADALVDPGSTVTFGEGESAVNGSPISYLNDKPSGLKTTGLTDHARQYALKLGLAAEDGGQLIALPTPIRTMEAWRREISQATDGSDPVAVRDSTILKGLIDAQTEPVAGPLYRQARAERTRFAQNYGNHAVISQLIKTKKGTADRAVALEDIHRRTILDGSLDDVRQVRRVLQRSGSAGHQAWRELQGQTLQFIKDQALGNSATDIQGNPVVSAAKLDRAIRSLDADGKLDYVFGKRGAEKLRTVNDVAKTVYTSPPGSVNTSNTASILAGMLDLGLGSMTGLPLPVASGARYLVANLKDRKLAARVKDALGTKQPESPPLTFRPNLSVVAPTSP